jgi:hypothetical protein
VEIESIPLKVGPMLGVPLLGTTIGIGTTTIGSAVVVLLCIGDGLLLDTKDDPGACTELGGDTEDRAIEVPLARLLPTLVGVEEPPGGLHAPEDGATELH